MPHRRDPREILRRLFITAVAAADPMLVVPRHLPPRGDGRVVVVGAGKAAARMAEAVESVWGPCEGLVIAADGCDRELQGIEVAVARHPLPDERGVAATLRILSLLESLGQEDEALVLISGGASALLVAPRQGVSLAEKQELTRQLLASGATIGEINVVRKHLSRVKGGQLAAAAWPARVRALMISDVPGDDPAQIGSGPTVGEDRAHCLAKTVVERYGIEVPAGIAAALEDRSSVLGLADELLSKTENVLISTPSQALAAADDLALRLVSGVKVRVLGDALEGEARELAREQAAMARAIRASMKVGDAPVLLLSGGEVTVTCKGSGLGGPNAEFALALALALEGAEGIYALACDTDGIDGAAPVAGAMIDPLTLARASAKGIDAAAALDNNDAHGFFASLGDQIVTGPTLTNVNDFRAILIYPPQHA